MHRTAIYVMATLVIGGLFAAPLVLTGAPWMFFGDSATYIHQAHRFVQLAPALLSDPAGASLDGPQGWIGRSIYYSLFLGAGFLFSSVWGVVTLQVALMLGVLAWLGARLARLDGVARGGEVEGALALCLAAAISSAPWFTALLMPDIFAGLLILLGAALLTFHDRMTRFEWGLAAAGMLAGAAMHDTHLLILGGLTVAAFLPRVASGPKGLSPLRCLMIGLCAAGAALSALNGPVQERLSQTPPARPPFVAVHLIAMGPGYDFLQERCPEAGYALCAFEIEPGLSWEVLLFGSTPGRGLYSLADTSTRIVLGEEQWRFASDVLAAYPVRTLTGLAADAWTQLGRFSLKSLGPHDHWDRYLHTLPHALQARYAEHNLLIRDPAGARAMLQAISAGIAVITAVSLAALALACIRLVPRAPTERAVRRRLRLAGLLLFGVVLNALICGGIASPYDRFQARLIWLVPVAAAVLVPVALRVKAPLPTIATGN